MRCTGNMVKGKHGGCAGGVVFTAGGVGVCAPGVQRLEKEGEFQGQDVGKGGHLRPKLALYALGTTPVD